jgi:hypothetical protein
MSDSMQLSSLQVQIGKKGWMEVRTVVTRERRALSERAFGALETASLIGMMTVQANTYAKITAIALKICIVCVKYFSKEKKEEEEEEGSRAW